ncbi:MAG: hypothetical protein AAF467_06165 [Actinomycetota bacterium]
MAAKRIFKQNLTPAALGLVTVVAVLVLAGCGTSETSGSVSFSAAWDDVDVAEASSSSPVELSPRQVHNLALTMTNESNQAVTIGHVRLQGSLLGLGFLDYDSTIRSVIEAGSTETVTVPIDAFAVDQQARGYLQGQITLYGPSREVLGAIDVPLDGRGSVTAYTMIFALLLTLLAVASVTWNAAARSRAIDPPDELTLAFHFAHSGVLVGGAVAALASTLRVWPVSGVFAAVLAAGAGALAFVVGYLTARQSVEFEHGTYRGAPASSAARLPTPPVEEQLAAAPAEMPAAAGAAREPLFPVGGDAMVDPAGGAPVMESLSFGPGGSEAPERRLLDDDHQGVAPAEVEVPARVVLESDDIGGEPELPLGISIGDVQSDLGVDPAADPEAAANADVAPDDAMAETTDTEIGAESDLVADGPDREAPADEAAGTELRAELSDAAGRSDDGPADAGASNSGSGSGAVDGRDRSAGEPQSTPDGRLALDDDALPPVLLLEEFDEADLAALEAEPEPDPGSGRDRRAPRGGRRSTDPPEGSAQRDDSGPLDIFERSRSNRRRDDHDDRGEPKNLGIWGS